VQLKARVFEAESNPWTTFLAIDPDTTTGYPVDTPTSLLSICQDILTEPRASHFNTSCSRLEIAEMIALAGFLLEYPVSYFPMGSIEIDGTAFFPNVVMDVFTCTISPWDKEQQSHIFMKFSRPSDVEPSVQELLERLKLRFESRLQYTTMPCTLQIHWESISMDRLAL